MGEYAIRRSDGVTIKIGFCESLWGLRSEDRAKVIYSDGDLSVPGWFFRLPYPDEDELPIGDYDWGRGSRLREGFCPDDIVENPGRIQLHHPSGLLANIRCYHGKRLPVNSDDVQFHWNGRDEQPLEIVMVKTTDHGLIPVFRCRHCRQVWSCRWHEILEFVEDDELRGRLEVYRDYHYRAESKTDNNFYAPSSEVSARYAAAINASIMGSVL